MNILQQVFFSSCWNGGPLNTMANFFQNLLPPDFDWNRYLVLLLIGVGAALVLGLLFRLIFGKASSLNHSVSSAIALLCVYALTVVIYSIGGSLSFILTPLPFVELTGDYLTIFPIMDAQLSVICAQILEMIVLGFLMNLLITWLPNGKNIISWYFFRFLAIVLAVCLHYVVHLLFVTILPNNFVDIAPAILLIVLLVSLLLGCLRLLTGGALAVIDPLLGVLYTFFFANIVGKQLSRAIVTAALLTALVYLLNYLEISVIYIASVALITYLPVIIIALVLWYVIGKLL